MQNEETAVTVDKSEDRRRWMALYVLCLGMLMIVLDITIVNVALPSIQSDLGFAQNDLAWVVNAYLIAFGGLLLLAGRVGDLIGQRRVFLIGLAVFTAASALRVGADPGDADRGAVHPGGRRRADLRRDPGDDRDDVPRAAGPGEGDRDLHVRRSLRRLDRATCGGALTEAINWHWIFFVNLPIGVATALWRFAWCPIARASGSRGGADIIGAVLLTGGLMLGVYTILEVRAGLGLHPDPDSRRAVARAARGVRSPPGADRQPADAVAAVPLAQRRRIEPGPGTDGRRDVRPVLPRSPLHAAHPRVRPVRGRPRVPAATIVMAAMSFRFTARLNMVRAAGDPDARHGVHPRRDAAVRLTPVDATYAVDLLPPMILIGLGAGLASRR